MRLWSSVHFNNFGALVKLRSTWEPFSGREMVPRCSELVKAHRGAVSRRCLTNLRRPGSRRSLTAHGVARGHILSGPCPILLLRFLYLNGRCSE